MRGGIFRKARFCSLKERLAVQATCGDVQIGDAIQGDLRLPDRRYVTQYTDIEKVVADLGRSETKIVPERRPILPIVSQRCVNRLPRLDCGSNASDLRLITFAALQISAVLSKDLAASVSGQAFEGFVDVSKGELAPKRGAIAIPSDSPSTSGGRIDLTVSEPRSPMSARLAARLPKSDGRIVLKFAMA